MFLFNHEINNIKQKATLLTISALYKVLNHKKIKYEIFKCIFICHFRSVYVYIL